MSNFSESAKRSKSTPAAISCLGKVGLDSYEHAARVLKRKGPKATAGRSAYHCGHCQLWHIGSDNGGIEKKRVAKFRERKAYE